MAENPLDAARLVDSEPRIGISSCFILVGNGNGHDNTGEQWGTKNCLARVEHNAAYTHRFTHEDARITIISLRFWGHVID